MSYEKNDNKRHSRRQMHYSPNLLDTVDNAISNKKIVILEYSDGDFEVTTRKVEPMAVIYKNRKRNFVAWCHLREDWRTFRLDRVEMLKLTIEDFNPRTDFNLADFEESEYLATAENDDDAEYDD